MGQRRSHSNANLLVGALIWMFACAGQSRGKQNEGDPARAGTPRQKAGPDDAVARGENDVNPNGKARGSALSADEQRDVDALARRVLSEELSNHTLPDINLLPKTGRVFVLSPSSGAPLSARAFGPVGKRTLRAATQQELQALADHLNTTVPFIILEIRITGDTADVHSGVDMVLPSTSDTIKLCCCAHSTTWRRVRGGWERDHSSPVAQRCS